MRHLVFNIWTDGRGEQWYGPFKILFPKEPSSQFGMWKLSKCMFTQHFPPPFGAWFQGSSWPTSLRIHQLRVKRNKGRGSPRLLVKYHLISFVLEPWRILLNPSLNSVKGCYNYFIWNQCDSKRWNGSFEIVYFILFFLGTGYLTEGLTQIRKILYYWTTFPTYDELIGILKGEGKIVKEEEKAKVMKYMWHEIRRGPSLGERMWTEQGIEGQRGMAPNKNKV